ncbi:Phox/Bem1p [Artemisia annua]|uniref:Phox/Bem1p n=1 Tax=Artemisia annua TaxID=35608 RepID=A0A2U1MKV4_ARTAN|nr:Phox/Bem1p [Artemisia annua]
MSPNGLFLVVQYCHYLYVSCVDLLLIAYECFGCTAKLIEKRIKKPKYLNIQTADFCSYSASITAGMRIRKTDSLETHATNPLFHLFLSLEIQMLMPQNHQKDITEDVGEDNNCDGSVTSNERFTRQPVETKANILIKEAGLLELNNGKGIGHLMVTTVRLKRNSLRSGSGTKVFLRMPLLSRQQRLCESTALQVTNAEMKSNMQVKHGETLRRFNASIDDNKLSLDIVMLQNKIRRLFFFESNVRFTLTYVDEDGDVITLATNDDLHDFVKQSLKPLRITVKLLYGTSATLVRTPEPVTLPAPSQPSYQRLVEHVLFLKRQKLPSPVEIIETTTYKMVQPTPTSGSHDGEKGANSKSSAYETMFI